MTPLTRRGAIRAIAGASAIVTGAQPLLAAGAQPLLAKAPVAGRQVPSVFRARVGTIEVTALLDGAIALPASLFGDDPAGVAKILASAGQSDPVSTPILAYLINTGDKLVLVDTGYRELGGAATGRLPAQLAAAGVKPDDIDIVALTHAHPDHIAGAVAPQGRAAFPNAELVLADAEMAFWTSDSVLNQAPQDARPFFELARAGLAPYAARTRRIRDGDEIVPGVTAIAAPGHTPGHTMFRVSSGASQLLVFGDIVHAVAIQFTHPDMSIAFDTDPATARATRRRVLDMVASDRIVVAGAHVPFPGIGTAVRDGTGYRYVPTTWGTDL